MKDFTTGQVAKICKASPRTVQKWFDSKMLRGYRMPGVKGERRVTLQCLIEFLREHGMPLGDLVDRILAKVLIVAQDEVLVESLRRELRPERSFKIAVTDAGFNAGIQAERLCPDCLVIDFSIGLTETLKICEDLRLSEDFGDAILVVLLPDDDDVIPFDRSLVNETFEKPFDVSLFAEQLRTLIYEKKRVA